jgi:Domain of unknown function (DUF4290)
MEYNTERPALLITEYGRNIQKMLDYTMALESRDERTKVAHSIVSAMAILNPQIKDYTDFKHKLWDHLFIMSDYKLDCDAPYPMPSPDAINPKPEKIPYPSYNIKYKHYGKTILNVIEEAKKLDNEQTRDGLAVLIANFMKQSYMNYNRDNVNDEVIFEQLKRISDGHLIVKEDTRLKAVYEARPLNTLSKNKKKKNRGSNNTNNNNIGRRK